MVNEKIPEMIICEDDVNLIGNSTQNVYLNVLLNEARQVSYDILFLSWFRYNGGSVISSHLRNPWTFCQLWAYAITLEGARKLLADERVKKLYEPVDVALWSSYCRKVVKNVVAYPPLCLTVGSYSDTANLK